MYLKTYKFVKHTQYGYQYIGIPLSGNYFEIKYTASCPLQEGDIVTIFKENGHNYLYMITGLNVLNPDNQQAILSIIYGLNSFPENLHQSMENEDLNTDLVRDLRSLKTYSIDPPGCTDIDDAFSLDHDMNIYIHIADVTRYLERNSPEYMEAYRRCETFYPISTTRYGPRREPYYMLSRQLTNRCSLSSDSDKYALTVQFQMCSESGLYMQPQIYQSIIRNRYKLTYAEAETLLDSEGEDGTIYKVMQITDILRHRRQGLELSQTTYGGLVKRQSRTSRMIAELAIVANEIVANFIKCHYPDHYSVFRQHHTNETNFNGSNCDIAQIITDRAAEYTENSGEHETLGLQSYLHFTSPIRRFPDIIVHLFVKNILNSTPEGVVPPLDKDNLVEMIFHFNKCHRLSKLYSYAQMNLYCLHLINRHHLSSSIVLNGRIIRYHKGFVNMLLDIKIDDQLIVTNFPYSVYIGSKLPSCHQRYIHFPSFDDVKIKTPPDFIKESLPDLDAYIKSLY